MSDQISPFHQSGVRRFGHDFPNDCGESFLQTHPRTNWKLGSFWILELIALQLSNAVVKGDKGGTCTVNSGIAYCCGIDCVCLNSIAVGSFCYGVRCLQIVIVVLIVIPLPPFIRHLTTIPISLVIFKLNATESFIVSDRYVSFGPFQDRCYHSLPFRRNWILMNIFFKPLDKRSKYLFHSPITPYYDHATVQQKHGGYRQKSQCHYSHSQH